MMPAHLFLLVLVLLFHSSSCNPTLSRKLNQVEQQPLVLKYHHGPLLAGNLTVRLLWYGSFSPAQRSTISDFILSLSSPPSSSSSSSSSSHSVASWWATTTSYQGRPIHLSLGPQLLLTPSKSLGTSLSSADLLTLASRGPHRNSITAILTAPDVTVDGFCMSRCGTHSSAPSRPNRPKSVRFPYLWVGNPASQCPGQCAWPFHQPIFGPQSPPLVPPNGDVGVDGMVINLATVLAGAVTNPFRTGFFQGPADAPLEAVSACTGIFGSGAFPGYPGEVLVDPTTGASYNANGIDGRKFLLPAMWDPNTSQCATLV